jgi:hypothetical protein
LGLTGAKIITREEMVKVLNEDKKEEKEKKE